MWAHPALNGWGLATGIFFGVVGIYASWDSRVDPLLSGQLHTVRTVLVSAEGVQTLQVSSGGAPISGPVTAAQLVIWNAGKRPVRSEDILEPITIRVAARLLGVRVLRSTREVLAVSVKEVDVAKGIVGVTFRIMEQGDAALIQITYEGSEAVRISGSGEVVGQKPFSIVEGTTRPPFGKLQAPLWLNKLLIAVALGFGLTFGVVVIARQIRAHFKADPAAVGFWGFMTLWMGTFTFFIVMTVIAIVAWDTWQHVDVPFLWP